LREQQAHLVSLLVLAAFLAGACGAPPNPQQVNVTPPTQPPAPTQAKPAWLATLEMNQTLQVTPLGVTLAPSRTSVPIEAILSDFPLAVGAKWVYAVEVTYLASYSDDGTVTYGYWNGTLVETIVGEATVDGAQAFEVAIETNPVPPPEVWVPPAPFYYEIAPDGVIRNGIKIYKWPLADGATWPAFEGIDYEWSAASLERVSTPFGTFTNCYTLALITGPDTTYEGFCPGVGVVQHEYFHHPSPPSERWSLISFQAAH
jgi:hypothetical protein